MCLIVEQHSNATAFDTPEDYMHSHHLHGNMCGKPTYSQLRTD